MRPSAGHAFVSIMMIPVTTKRRQAAFTLLELMVSAGLSALILGMIMYCFLFASRSFVAMGNYIDLNNTSLHALDVMSRDIREASSLQSFTTNQLVLRDASSNQLTFAWNPTVRQLTRSSGVTTATLLKDCDYLSFDMSQRNPTANGVMGFYSASNNAAICKLVSVSWRCSRTILGQTVNTESVQTAKIAMRN
jgi:type II secretory pathway component PulJ